MIVVELVVRVEIVTGHVVVLEQSQFHNVWIREIVYVRDRNHRCCECRRQFRLSSGCGLRSKLISCSTIACISVQRFEA